MAVKSTRVRYIEATRHVDHSSQHEVDEFWDKLSKGGEKSRCGWLKDKYGVSWQIVPTVLEELLRDKDAEKSKRVMHRVLPDTLIASAK